MVLCLIITFKFSLVSSSLYWLFLRQMFASLMMTQTHVCYVSANMDAIRNRDPVVFSAVIVHALVRSALLNHGASTGTPRHLATVTILTAATTRLEFLLSLAIVYKQTSHKSVPLSTDLYHRLCALRFTSLVPHFIFS